MSAADWSFLGRSSFFFCSRPLLDFFGTPEAPNVPVAPFFSCALTSGAPSLGPGWPVMMESDPASSASSPRSPRSSFASFPRLRFARSARFAPIGGSFLESTDVTVSGDFFPGFDGLKGSARCKFGDQVSTPDLLEAKNGKIVCSSPPRPTSNRRSAAGGPGYEEVSFSVALNTVDFVDYAGYFTYYDHQLDTISPQGGQLQGGSAVTIYGKRFRTLVDAVGASADSR